MDKTKEKILLIKLSSMGDVIFCVPLANALKNWGMRFTGLSEKKGTILLIIILVLKKLFLSLYKNGVKTDLTLRI